MVRWKTKEEKREINASLKWTRFLWSPISIIQTTNYRLQTPDSRHQTPDSRFKTSDTSVRISDASHQFPFYQLPVPVPRF